VEAMSGTGQQQGSGQSVTKYSKEFSIPPEFPELLRDLTREILRNQPKDINRFAYDFFSNELQQRTAEDNS